MKSPGIAAGVKRGRMVRASDTLSCTSPKEIGAKMRKAMPHTVILVPGYGAQGGSGKDIRVFFDEDGRGAIVNSSRGIIAAYKNDKYSSYGEDGFADAARAATEDMIKDITDNL